MVASRREQRPAVLGPDDLAEIAIADVSEVGPWQWGEGMSVQESHNPAAIIANSKPGPVGGAEGNAVRLATAWCWDRDHRPDVASKIASIEPYLAVQCYRRQSSVRRE